MSLSCSTFWLSLFYFYSMNEQLTVRSTLADYIYIYIFNFKHSFEALNCIIEHSKIDFMN